MPRITRLAIQTAVVTCLLCAALAPLNAQGQGNRMPSRPATGFYESAGAKNEPFIDNKVGSLIERYTRWKARMKRDHFTRYLVGYASIAGAFTGLAFALIGFRLGDPMAPYRRIRNRTILLALASGAGLGVFLAVTEVPAQTTGKLTLLLAAVVCSAAAAAVGSTAGFVVLRALRNRKSRRAGEPLSDRLRYPR